MNYNNQLNTSRSQAVPEPFQSRSQAVPEPFQSRSQTVPESFQNRSWTWKASRNAQKKRYGLERIIISVSVLAFVFGLTILHQPFQVQVIGYSLAFAIILLLNPCDVIGRFLAVGSRLLIATNFIFVSGLALSFSWSALLVFFILLLISVALIYFCNRIWLATYNWKNTEEVQKVLSVDREDTCSRSWQAHGKRECRTLMYQLGFSADDNALDIYYKPVYLLGYLHGIGKSKQVSSLEIVIQKNKELCQKQYKELEQLRKENEKLQESIKLLEENSICADAFQSKYLEQLRLTQELMKANDELINNSPEQSQSSSLSLEDKVVKLHEDGLSYRQIADACNCSKTKAFNIINQKRAV